jgi:excisionase family DNA binding protein
VGEILLHPATYSYIELHIATSSYIMSSNMRIEKTCQYCGNSFTAKTTVTKFCSTDCAKRAYKVRIRVDKIGNAIKEAQSSIYFNPIVSQKDFLNINEAGQLLGASRWTIYRLIEDGKLKATKIGRRTIIKRHEIEKLFK